MALLTQGVMESIDNKNRHNCVGRLALSKLQRGKLAWRIEVGGFDSLVGEEI